MVDLVQRLHRTRCIAGGDDADGEEKGKSYDLVLMVGGSLSSYYKKEK